MDGKRMTYVLFTVDVESRRGRNPCQDIWGEGGKSSNTYGIARIMESFDRHGVKGTFFVNVYEAAKHGSEALAEVCGVIAGKGHDVELHSHPKPMFGYDYMQCADQRMQVEILQRGKQLAELWTGTDVIAHRSGGYMGNLDTISACSLAGIALDFSYNAAWPGSQLGKSGLTFNRPFVREGVLLVPVTSFVQAGFGRWTSMRFLDIESCSAWEIRKVVSSLHKHGVRTAVVMLHSFGFCRRGRAKERCQRALDGLLAAFASSPHLKVVCARELYEVWRCDPSEVIGGDAVPRTGLWPTYCRAWLRLTEGRKNLVVALLPVAVAVLLAWIILLWIFQ